MKDRQVSNFPRVLVVSHNPFSLVHNNGKTLTAFFRNWPQENIAQIYLTTDVPDFSLCKKFFQLHDFDILKQFFVGGISKGRRLMSSDLDRIYNIKQGVKGSIVLRTIRNNFFPVFQLVKDLLWCLIGFKSRELFAFIDEFNPQVVFFHSYKDVFSFSIANWICRSRNIALVMYISDDYVSGRLTLDPFFWIQLFRVRREYKKSIARSSFIVAGSEKMADEFKDIFGGNYIVAMNAIAELNFPLRKTDGESVKFLYAGNIGLNRWKVLSLIARCLEEIGVECGIRGELSIYSLNEPTRKQLRKFNIPGYSEFRGALNTEELNIAKEQANVLVHVESFDRISRHITRLSVSTKISEYLASRRCIFAVGPANVASIEYLVKHDLGIVVVNENKIHIKNALKRIMSESDMRVRYADKGVEVARLRHSAEGTADIIYKNVFEAAGL